MASSSNSPSPDNLGEIVASAVEKEMLQTSGDSLQSVETRQESDDDKNINKQYLRSVLEDASEPGIQPPSPPVRNVAERCEDATRSAKEQLFQTCLNSPKTSESAAQTTEIASASNISRQRPTERHIMISYNRASCSEIACQIYERLVDEGYKVWIDSEDLHGSVLGSMAEGVGNSYIVLFLMNSEYYQSKYCAKEAKFTVQSGIDFIPCVMQPDFVPEGWLGMLIDDRLRVDFSLPIPFETAFARLISEIRHIRSRLEIRRVHDENTVTQTQVEKIIRDYMRSINKIDQELPSLTKEELLQLVTHLRQQISTETNVPGTSTDSLQTQQIIQQLLAQSRNQQELLRRAVQLLSTLNTTAAILKVFSIVLFLWTTYQFFEKRFSK